MGVGADEIRTGRQFRIDQCYSRPVTPRCADDCNDRSTFRHPRCYGDRNAARNSCGFRSYLNFDGESRPRLVVKFGDLPSVGGEGDRCFHNTDCTDGLSCVGDNGVCAEVPPECAAESLNEVFVLETDGTTCMVTTTAPADGVDPIKRIGEVDYFEFGGGLGSGLRRSTCEPTGDDDGNDDYDGEFDGEADGEADGENINEDDGESDGEGGGESDGEDDGEIDGEDDGEDGGADDADDDEQASEGDGEDGGVVDDDLA